MDKRTPRIFNLPEMKNQRRELRKSLTRAEAILWTHLQNRKLAGKKFRRKASIGPYIVDFFCPEFRLAIEVDEVRQSAAVASEVDAKRATFLEQQGIRVMRLEDKLIYKDLQNVLALITQKVSAEPKTRA